MKVVESSMKLVALGKYGIPTNFSHIHKETTAMVVEMQPPHY